MDRRSFLKSLFGVAAIPLAGALPAPPETQASGVTLEMLREVTAKLQRHAVPGPYYVGWVHPDCYADLIAFNARGEWDVAHRLARTAGDRHLTPREILAKYKPDRIKPEFGRVEGVRFITSERLNSMWLERRQWT